MKKTSNYHGYRLQIIRYESNIRVPEYYKKGKVYKSRQVAEKQISKILDSPGYHYLDYISIVEWYSGDES